MYSVGVLNFVLKIFKKQIILSIIPRKAIWKCETDLYSVLLYVVIELKNGILFMKSRKYNHAWSLDKVPQRERTTYGIINKVIYYDKAKDKDITCGLEIVVAWDNERKRFVFSFIDRQIKKILTEQQGFFDIFRGVSGRCLQCRGFVYRRFDNSIFC